MKKILFVLAAVLLVATAQAKKVKVTIDGRVSPSQTKLYLIINEDTANAQLLPIKDAKFSVTIKVDKNSFIRLHDYKDWPERSVFVLIPDSKHITIEGTGADGKTVAYEVATDAEYLRQAMDEAEGLTYSGTESEFGMMVEVVNGEQAVYAEDNAYWAFYVNGEYGQYGIDSQPVNDGDKFGIVYESAAGFESAGSKNITIEVTGSDGNTVTYEVSTDAEYLREAMDETEGLTYSGTESEFGMMVEVVNDEQAIYAEDNAYWAL